MTAGEGATIPTGSKPASPHGRPRGLSSVAAVALATLFVVGGGGLVYWQSQSGKPMAEPAYRGVRVVVPLPGDAVPSAIASAVPAGTSMAAPSPAVAAPIAAPPKDLSWTDRAMASMTNAADSVGNAAKGGKDWLMGAMGMAPAPQPALTPTPASPPAAAPAMVAPAPVAPAPMAPPPAAMAPAMAAAAPPARPDMSPAAGRARPMLDADLVEQSAIGPLPLAKNGKTPWKTYAAPYDLTDKGVRIAIVVGGLGLSRAATDKAITALPERVTLAFSPYGAETLSGIERARLDGHETLLTLALEPPNFPQSDPGPYTLLSSLGDKENVARLQWVMSRAQGYVGLITEFGEIYTATSRHLIGPLNEMRRRGLLIVDSHVNPVSLLPRTARDIGVPRAWVDHILDADFSRDSIDAKLMDLERIAKQTGQAVGYANASPVVVERLQAWLPAMARRGYSLAPVSSVVDLQKDTK